MVLRASLGILLLMLAFNAKADLEITIAGGQTAAQPIAIVPFSAPAGVTFDIAKIVDADLSRTGTFRTLARADMLEKPSEVSAVNYTNWRQVGMDTLVIGQMKAEASGKVSTRFFVLDTVRGQQLMAYDMPPAAPEQLRQVAHQVADLIYEKLTGIPGAFNTKIAYIAASGIGVSRKFQLVVADADGDSPHVVAISREPLMSPAWSPDRRQLAYVGFDRGRSTIYLHTLASGQVRKLVSEKGINGSPAWSPDGRSMAVTLSFETNPDIYIIDIETGTRRRITTHYGIDTEAAWSPDGKNLVFTSDRGGQPQIYQVSVADGGDPKRLTFEGKQNLRASYSPDGKSLVLVTLDGGRYRIATLDLTTNDLRVLTDGPQDESPSYSPNGVVIIYTTQGAHGLSELGTVSIDGRVKQRLRQAGGDVRELAWSPLLR
jgi:TolB protein